MYQELLGNMELRLRHRHSDGSWGEMTERRAHHDPSEHDVERDWAGARTFGCAECGEEVVMVPAPEDAPPERR